MRIKKIPNRLEYGMLDLFFFKIEIINAKYLRVLITLHNFKIINLLVCTYVFAEKLTESFCKAQTKTEIFIIA